MRIFTAAMLPEQAKASLGGMLHSLESSLPGRYVLPENLHCTLAFIGAVEPTCVRAVLEALQSAAAGVEPINARLHRLGYFGARNSAILWHGLEGANELTRINARLIDELAARGLHVGDTRFNAHITLARNVDLTRTEIATLPACDLPTCITQLAVYESARQNGILRYTPLCTVQLKPHDRRKI